MLTSTPQFDAWAAAVAVVLLLSVTSVESQCAPLPYVTLPYEWTCLGVMELALCHYDCQWSAGC